ncbi:MAG TPA: hypothetical protein VF559_04590 [Caulobacteraceae bacterium]|jgi:hypothetical protein
MHDVRVRAAEPWNDLGVVIRPGETIAFEAEGTWRDWFVDTDADGYSRLVLRLFEPFRRAPECRWFALMGAFDRDLRRRFLIGRRSTHTFAEGGRLFAFANDLPAKYGNNSQSLTLRMTRPL